MARQPLKFESLENRLVLDYTFGFQTLAAVAGVNPGGLFYFIEGGANADTIIVNQNVTGINYVVSYVDPDDPLNTIVLSGNVSTGEIALAQLITGQPFRGVHVDALGNPAATSDVVDGTGLLGYALFAEGGAGDDILAGGRGMDSLHGGSGNDSAFGLSGNDLLTGGTGNDFLDGMAGRDTAHGELGNDYVVTDGRDIALSGGTGGVAATEPGDTLDASGAGGGLTYANSDFETIIGGPGNDSIDSQGYVAANSEGDNLPGPGDISGVLVDGGAGQDGLIGSTLNDVLLGSTGNDTVDGAGGSDFMDGGPHTSGDWLSYAHPSNSPPVFVDLATGGNNQGDTFINFENVIGSGGDDTINGNAGDNNIIGGGGNDSINGGAGNDTAQGGLGDDTLLGGDGNDSLNGGDGADTMDGGFDNDTLDGGAGADRYQGNSGNDLLILGYHHNFTQTPNSGGAAGGGALSTLLTGAPSLLADADVEIFGGAGMDTFRLIHVGSDADTTAGVNVVVDPLKVVAWMNRIDDLYDLGDSDYDPTADATVLFRTTSA